MKKIILSFTLLGLLISTPIATTSANDVTTLQQRIDTIMAKYAPYMGMAQDTLDKQTIKQIIAGQVNIPDEAINEVISRNLSKQEQVTALRVKSKKNGRLEIHADTVKYGGIDMSGTIEAFVHNKDNSYITYNVKDKDLEKYGGIKGWMFAHLSVSMLEKFLGNVELGDNVDTTVQGNKITVDYKDILAKSSIANTNIGGYNLVDVIQIDSAIPRDGYIEVHTSLNVPSYVKDIMAEIVK